MNEKLGDRITGVANSNLKKMLVVNASSTLLSARVLNLETTVAEMNDKVDERWSSSRCFAASLSDSQSVQTMGSRLSCEGRSCTV